MTTEYNREEERIQFKKLDALIELATPKVKDVFLRVFKKTYKRDWTQHEGKLLIKLKPEADKRLKQKRTVPPKGINLADHEIKKIEIENIELWDLPLLQKAICIISPDAAEIDAVQTLVEIRNFISHEGRKQVNKDEYKIHQKRFLESSRNLGISRREVIEIFEEAKRRVYYDCRVAADNLCDKAEIDIRKGKLQDAENYCKEAIEFLNDIFMEKINEHKEVLKETLNITEREMDKFGVNNRETLPFHAWRAICLRADCAYKRNDKELARACYQHAYELHQKLYLETAMNECTSLENQESPMKFRITILNFLLLEIPMEESEE